MLTILSPAKKLNLNCSFNQENITYPNFSSKANELINILRTKSKEDLMNLMKISDNLAELNQQRNKDFNESHNINNSFPAAKFFDGEVYNGLEFNNLSKKTDNIAYAQNHLRILSGLYGVLKPMDLIQPYRLEMGSQLANNSGKNLYQFWSDIVTDYLNNELDKHENKIIINLASVEYSKVINKKKLRHKIYNISFKDNINGKLRTIMVYAKNARGLMANSIIKNKIDDLEILKELIINDYKYSFDNSKNEEELIFIRNN
ncbi:MAG: peroxide stress protein YaaA [Rickettsiales bacterium]|nr:peroxide stress protein YaaA [Rickettsiales bacterium]